MDPILIKDMPEEEYHASSGLEPGQFITRSMIVDYNEDRPSFKLKHIDKHPLMQFKGNKGTDFGSYFESYLLDGDTSAYRTIPETCYSMSKKSEVNWNLRAGQYVMDGTAITGVTTKEWIDDHPLIVSAGDIELAAFMEKRFGDTALGQYWLNNIKDSDKQVVIRWTDEATGLNMQVRLDHYREGQFTCDLKSTAKRLENFSNTADDYGYHFQDSMYSDGIEILTGKRIPFLFAIGETTGLKRAVIRQLHPLQVSYAKKMYHLALKGIKEENYNAPGFDNTEAEQCELKPYQLYKYEDES